MQCKLFYLFYFYKHILFINFFREIDYLHLNYFDEDFFDGNWIDLKKYIVISFSVPIFCTVPRRYSVWCIGRSSDSERAREIGSPCRRVGICCVLKKVNSMWSWSVDSSKDWILSPLISWFFPTKTHCKWHLSGEWRVWWCCSDIFGCSFTPPPNQEFAVQINQKT